MSWFMCPKCKHIIPVYPCSNCGHIESVNIKTDNKTTPIKEKEQENE